MKHSEMTRNLMASPKILHLLTLILMCINGSQVDATMVSLGPQSDQNCMSIGGDRSKVVCVCSERSCSSLPYSWPQESGQAQLIETTRAGDRFKVSSLTDSLVKLNSSSIKTVRVMLDAKRQTVLGWGGAFTDSTAINIGSLSPELGELLLESYFGRDGLHYNFGRVPIAGSDFSTRPYSYADSDTPDLNLTHWSLAHEDMHLKIPIIKRAQAIALKAETKLKLFASPWSPPVWMKTSHDFRRGFLIDDKKIYQSYANYLMRFFAAYKLHGIDFWGATVQNEPMSAYLPLYYWNSLQMSNSQAIEFISEHLGPALEANGYTKDNFKLMVGDDSLGFLNLQVPTIMKNPQVQKYVSGLAFHWYTSGSVAPYDSLTKVVDAIKDHIEFVIMSEACEGSVPGSKHVDLGSWDRAESYANDIIEDLRRRTGAWIDWNMALDLSGGPNWAGNLVDSPIIVNKSANEFYKQPMYYALAHFSRFFRPGSVYTVEKVDATGWSLLARQHLKFAAAQLEGSGYVVVTVLNKASKPETFDLKLVSSHKPIHLPPKRVRVEARSINTIVWKL